MKKLILISVLFLLFRMANAQEQVIISDKTIPGNDTVWVFKPQNYDAKKTYPTVFLLHGWSGNFRQWSQDADLQYFANTYQFIFICPDGFYDSWYINSPKKENWQYESFFFNKLIPSMEKKYAMDKSNYFISGLSMGGHGALLYFINHNGVFKAAASTSGAINLIDRDIRLGLERLLGPKKDNFAAWKAISVYHNIDKIRGSQKPFLIDCGKQDGLYKYNYQLYQKAQKLGFNVTFISANGAHEHAYWHRSLPYHLAFFNEQVRK